MATYSSAPSSATAIASGILAGQRQAAAETDAASETARARKLRDLQTLLSLANTAGVNIGDGSSPAAPPSSMPVAPAPIDLGGGASASANGSGGHMDFGDGMPSPAPVNMLPKPAPVPAPIVPPANANVMDLGTLSLGGKDRNLSVDLSQTVAGITRAAQKRKATDNAQAFQYLQKVAPNLYGNEINPDRDYTADADKERGVQDMADQLVATKQVPDRTTALAAARHYVDIEKNKADVRADAIASETARHNRADESNTRDKNDADNWTAIQGTDPETGQPSIVFYNKKTGEKRVDAGTGKPLAGGGRGGGAQGAQAPLDDMIAQYKTIEGHAADMAAGIFRPGNTNRVREAVGFGNDYAQAEGKPAIGSAVMGAGMDALGIGGAGTPNQQRFQSLMAATRAIGDDAAKVFKGRQGFQNISYEVAQATLRPEDAGRPDIIDQKLSRLRHIIKLAGLTNPLQAASTDPADAAKFGFSVPANPVRALRPTSAGISKQITQSEYDALIAGGETAQSLLQGGYRVMR